MIAPVTSIFSECTCARNRGGLSNDAYWNLGLEGVTASKISRRAPPPVALAPRSSLESSLGCALVLFTNKYSIPLSPRMAPGAPSSPTTLQSCAALSATYTNSSTTPHTTHQFSHSISAPFPDPGSTSVQDKTAYLSKLRTSTKQLQEEMNVFLTQKMEEDKFKAATTGGPSTAGGKLTDEVEEENYGEEGVEDEEEGG